MNKNIETGKPVMNRTRRQLLIGAGLTPLVVTLHASKVSAQELVESVSGAAPFSGVIQGSVGPDGTPGSEDTEHALYLALESNTELQAYYGNMGSGTNDGTNYTWEYGAANIGNGNPGNWTPEYEKRFWEPVEEYQLAVNEILNAANDIKAAADTGIQAVALTSDPVTETIKNDLAAVDAITPKDVSVGVFAIVNPALTSLPTLYETAKTKYSEAVTYFNNSLASSAQQVDDGITRTEITSIF
ncbi:MAG: hypothetical protein E7028_09725 [Planctomycetaceae bacterium]|nr:hypothetical protein [Planctomycetaceae bacterium]